MDIITKASELGKLIADSKEMSRLKQSEVDMENDSQAQTLMNEYKQLQIEMVRAAKSNSEKEVLDEIKARLLNKQQEINDYPVTKEYLEAKAQFDAFMKKINDVIIFSITGEETCSPSKCGSCSGCK